MVKFAAEWDKLRCVHAKSLHLCLTLCDPMNVSLLTPLSMGLFRKEYWSGLPFPSPGSLPNPGIEPTSLMSSAFTGEFFTTSTTWEALNKLKLDNYSCNYFLLGNTVMIIFYSPYILNYVPGLTFSSPNSNS